VYRLWLLVSRIGGGPAWRLPLQNGKTQTEKGVGKLTTEDGTLEVHESGKGLTVEPGIYPATVKVVDDDEGKFGPQWRFTLGLDEYPEEEAWAWASANLGTKAKLHGWAGILLGRPLAIGEKISRSELVGKRCQVVIKEREDGDGGKSRYVDDIMKAKGTLPRPLESAPPPTPAPETIVDDSAPENHPAPFGQVSLVANRLNDVPQEVGLALCEKYGIEVAFDGEGKLQITNATNLTGGAKGTAEAMVGELNVAKRAAKQTA